MAKPVEKKRTYEEALAHLRRKFGKDILEHSASERPQGVIPTGIRTVDELTNLGGLPRGRIVEIFSPEGSGKSTLALHAIRSAQHLFNPPQIPIWIDYEDSWTDQYAQTIGVDTDPEKITVLKPFTAEEGFYAAAQLIQAGQPPLVVIDSIAAATPEAEMDAFGQGIGRKAMHATIVTNFVKWLNPAIARSGTTVVVINQLRSVIAFNQAVAQTVTTPGGRALKFYAAMRIQLHQGKAVRKNRPTDIPGAPSKAVVAHIIHVAIPKNKLATPFARGDVVLVHGVGFREIKRNQ